MKLLLALLTVLSIAGSALAADIPPMPDLENDYVPVIGQPVGDCPSVVAIGYEAADGSTADDPSFPLIAWYLLDETDKRLRPFLIVLFDSQDRDGRIRAGWIDYDRDGVADEFGDLKRLKEILPSLSVCDLAQRVK